MTPVRQALPCAVLRHGHAYLVIASNQGMHDRGVLLRCNDNILIAFLGANAWPCMCMACKCKSPHGWQCTAIGNGALRLFMWCGSTDCSQRTGSAHMSQSTHWVEAKLCRAQACLTWNMAWSQPVDQGLRDACTVEHGGQIDSAMQTTAPKTRVHVHIQMDPVDYEYYWEGEGRGGYAVGTRPRCTCSLHVGVQAARQ